jgi:hypothetical protein
MDLSTPEVRRWSSQTLRYIAQTMGIQQAAVLASGHRGVASMKLKIIRIFMMIMLRI